MPKGTGKTHVKYARTKKTGVSKNAAAGRKDAEKNVLEPGTWNEKPLHKRSAALAAQARKPFFGPVPRWEAYFFIREFLAAAAFLGNILYICNFNAFTLKVLSCIKPAKSL